MSNDFWKGYFVASVLSILSILFLGTVAHCEDVRTIIIEEANKQGFDPQVALSIAMIESSMNPMAIGPVKELGLFQIRPEYSKLPRIALFDARTNAREGIAILIKYQKMCPVKDKLSYVICFNSGLRHPKYPYLHPYYKRFKKAYAAL